MNEDIIKNILIAAAEARTIKLTPKQRELVRTILGNPAKDSSQIFQALNGMKGDDALRLQIKYLVFDLEATRRENVELRRMLGEMNQ
jgi:hypothetical protein